MEVLLPNRLKFTSKPYWQYRNSSRAWLRQAGYDPKDLFAPVPMASSTPVILIYSDGILSSTLIGNDRYSYVRTNQFLFSSPQELPLKFIQNLRKRGFDVKNIYVVGEICATISNMWKIRNSLPVIKSVNDLPAYLFRHKKPKAKDLIVPPKLAELLNFAALDIWAKSPVGFQTISDHNQMFDMLDKLGFHPHIQLSKLNKGSYMTLDDLIIHGNNVKETLQQLNLFFDISSLWLSPWKVKSPIVLELVN